MSDTQESKSEKCYEELLGHTYATLLLDTMNCGALITKGYFGLENDSKRAQV